MFCQKKLSYDYMYDYMYKTIYVLKLNLLAEFFHAEEKGMAISISFKIVEPIACLFLIKKITKNVSKKVK